MDSVAVIDLGSKTFRAGLAANHLGDDEPRVSLPSAVRVLPDDPDIDPYDVAPTRVVENATVLNFRRIESLLYYSFYGPVGWEIGNEGGVVVAEPLFTSKADREQLVQILFETFNIAGVFVHDQPVLALYGIGKVTGCVVDIGFGKVDVTAVTEGLTSMSSAKRLAFNGESLSNHLGALLSARGCSVGKLESLESLKEQCTSACESAAAYASAAAKDSSETYKLPDGQEVEIGSEGLLMAEALFQPSLAGFSGPGIVEAVADSIAQEGSDRKKLAENVFICGGGSSIPNLQGRFAHDLKLQLPISYNASVCSVPDYLPAKTYRLAAWSGGAILARVLQQQNQFMTKADYEDFGPTAVHRKCC